MGRRTFPDSLTGASLRVSLEDSATERAGAGVQHPTEAGASQSAFATADTAQAEVAGNTVLVRRDGKGPAILQVQAVPKRERDA